MNQWIEGPDLLWFEREQARVLLELETPGGAPSGKVWQTRRGNYVVETHDGYFHAWDERWARRIGLMVRATGAVIADTALAHAIEWALDAGER